MTGTQNDGFEGDPETTISGKVSLTLAGDDHDAAPPSPAPLAAKNIDPVSKVLVTVRSTVYDFFASHERFTKVSLILILNGLAIAYFVGAIVHYTQGELKEMDWCGGFGLLVLIYSFGYLLYLYYFIKRRKGKWIEQHCWHPINRLWDRMWENRISRFIILLAPVVALVAYLIIDTASNRRRLISFGGVIFFMLFGFLFSKHPGQINWRPVFWGLGLQFVFGLIAIRWPDGRTILMCIGDKVATFLQYTNNGTSFVYGHIVTDTSQGTVFAFATLPVIFFFSFFVNILSYYGVLQVVIMKIGWGIQKVMGTTVCESVNAAASIFLGMTESPLLFRNHVKDLTKSELHAIMCEGWATIAGTVMAAYISFGVNPGHLISASVMSAPAALCYSKLFYPETEVSKNTVDNIVLDREPANNVLDAACKGAMAALDLVAGIIANIIAFLAFVAFLDAVITWVGTLVGFEELSFQYLLSKIFIPVSFVMGVDTESLEDVAVLVGTKTVVNEFRAYQIMGEMVKEGRLSPRTEAITTYALCGFSNFSSIGILIGGLSALAPSQRSNMTEVALRGFIAANIVCFLTACIAGTLIDDDFLAS